MTRVDTGWHGVDTVINAPSLHAYASHTPCMHVYVLLTACMPGCLHMLHSHHRPTPAGAACLPACLQVLTADEGSVVMWALPEGAGDKAMDECFLQVARGRMSVRGHRGGGGESAQGHEGCGGEGNKAVCLCG